MFLKYFFVFVHIWMNKCSLLMPKLSWYYQVRIIFHIWILFLWYGIISSFVFLPVGLVFFLKIDIFMLSFCKMLSSLRPNPNKFCLFGNVNKQWYGCIGLTSFYMRSIIENTYFRSKILYFYIDDFLAFLTQTWWTAWSSHHNKYIWKDYCKMWASIKHR